MWSDADGLRVFAEIINKATSKRRIDNFFQGLAHLSGLVLEDSSEIVINRERGAHLVIVMPSELMSRHQMMRSAT